MLGYKVLEYSRDKTISHDERVSRQQKVLTILLQKISKDRKVLIKYEDLLTSLSDSYRTDIPKELITLMVKKQLREMPSWNIITKNLSGDSSKEYTYTL